MTEPKLWSDRGFDECCYPVSGEGRFTLVCAVVGRGSYCETHRLELHETYTVKPKQAYKPRKRRPAPTTVAGFVPIDPTVFTPEMRAVIDRIADANGMSGGQLTARARSVLVAPAVHQAMAEIYELRGEDGKRLFSTIRIGKAFNRHYSTVLFAIRKAEAMATNLQVAA